MWPRPRSADRARPKELLCALLLSPALAAAGPVGGWSTCKEEARDPACFVGHFVCEDCCDTADAGPGGNTKCWGGGYTYERCCPPCPWTHEPSCFPPESPRRCDACCDRALGPRGDPSCWSQGQSEGAGPLSFERCCLGRQPICGPAAGAARPGLALQTSQYGQDRFALDWLGCPADGFYVDVGAYDGEHLSNTHAMDVDLGWRGICVDAVLRTERFQGRSCHLVHGAVHARTGSEMRFQRFGDHHGGAYGGLSEAAREAGKGGVDEVLGAWESVPVLTVTMADVFRDAEAAGHRVPRVIDFVSVDVEGSVPDVLAGFPFAAFCVRVWSLEVWNPALLRQGRPEGLLRTAALLQGHGYLLVQVLTQDHVFVHMKDCGA